MRKAGKGLRESCGEAFWTLVFDHFRLTDLVRRGRPDGETRFLHGPVGVVSSASDQAAHSANPMQESISLFRQASRTMRRYAWDRNGSWSLPCWVPMRQKTSGPSSLVVVK